MRQSLDIMNVSEAFKQYHANSLRQSLDAAHEAVIWP